MFGSTLKTEKIQPRSIYNQLAAQQTQEQNIVVAQKEHRTKTLDKKIEQDTSNTADSTISEDKNRQVSEVKQQKIRKERHSFDDNSHGGFLMSYIDSNDETKSITIFRDGYRKQYDCKTLKTTILPKLTQKEINEEMDKIRKKREEIIEKMRAKKVLTKNM